MTHELKTWPEFFVEVWEGRKAFELRKNDRDFKIGDKVRLLEYSAKNGYSGREANREISFILEGGMFGLIEGNCILSLI